MTTVYLETSNGTHSEVIATFASDEIYSYCWPALKDYATANNGILSESES